MGKKTLNFFTALASMYILTTVGFVSEVTHAPGVLIENSPYQSENYIQKKKWEVDNFVFTPLAEFSVDARVLSSQRYWIGESAGLSPVDLALGWGKMSDSKNLEKISIKQRGRFYYWKTKDQNLPISRQEIISSSANMHLIPANKEIAKKIKTARRGDLIEMDGYLVKIDKGDDWNWTSSMTRADDGEGACEVVWVEKFEIKT